MITGFGLSGFKILFAHQPVTHSSPYGTYEYSPRTREEKPEKKRVKTTGHISYRAMRLKVRFSDLANPIAYSGV
jgi:hypothetical protein